MFVGRLGPLTLVLALAARARPAPYRPAVETDPHRLTRRRTAMTRSVLVVGLGRFGTAAALELMRARPRGACRRHRRSARERRRAGRDPRRPTGRQRRRRAPLGRRRRLRARDRRDQRQHRGEHLRDDGAQDARGRATSSRRRRTPLHAAILSRVGADRVVFAEGEMGRELGAHLRDPRRRSTTSTSPRASGSRMSGPRPRSSGGAGRARRCCRGCS